MAEQHYDPTIFPQYSLTAVLSKRGKPSVWVDMHRTNNEQAAIEVARVLARTLPSVESVSIRERSAATDPPEGYRLLTCRAPQSEQGA